MRERSGAENMQRQVEALETPARGEGRILSHAPSALGREVINATRLPGARSAFESSAAVSRHGRHFRNSHKRTLGRVGLNVGFVIKAVTTLRKSCSVDTMNHCRQSYRFTETRETDNSAIRT